VAGGSTCCGGHEHVVLRPKHMSGMEKWMK